MKAKFTKEISKVNKNITNQKTYNKLSKILSSKTISIDIGANYGDFIFFVKSIAPQSSFYGIEPDPVKFKTLYQNCLEWEKGTDSKIYALNIAMGDRDGQADFYHTVTSDGKSILKPDLQTQAWKKITVDIYKLDTLFKPMKPDLIKIDAQGSELQILQGSTEILKLGKTKFLITFNNQPFDEIDKFMNSFSYHSRIFAEIIFI